MAKGYVISYAGDIICATDNRELLVLYFYQKGIRHFKYHCNLHKVSKKKLYSDYYDYILYIHEETGMVVTHEDVVSYEQRREKESEMYSKTLESLKVYKNRLTKKKDIRKLEDAIEVLEKRKSLLSGKESNRMIMEDILRVPIETIYEERELFRNFCYSISKDD